MEEERLTKVVIDTYTLLAIVYDEVGEKARRILEAVRLGEIRGLIPVTVAYEYLVHWLRGRIPALKSVEEVDTYLKNYFKIIDLGYSDYVKAAEIKVKGDELLSRARDEKLRYRRLSFVDSTVIAVAVKEKIPVVSGDRDLAYVATRYNVAVIW